MDEDETTEVPPDDDMPGPGPDAVARHGVPALPAAELPADLIDAALAGWDPRYARIAGGSVSPCGTAAVAVLLTDEPPAIEPYVMTYSFADGVWSEGSGGNGPGVCRFDAEDPGAPACAVDWNADALVPEEVGLRVLWTTTAGAAALG